MEPTYQVGDFVRIREGLKKEHYYDGLFFNHCMERMCGEQFEVVSVIRERARKWPFTYMLRGTNWDWNDAMLEPVYEDQFDDSPVDICVILGGA